MSKDFTAFRSLHACSAISPARCLILKVVDRVGFLLNRTYKKALGSKTPRIIHRIGAYDSKRAELIQLADVLLAALSYSLIPSPKLTSASSLALIEHCATGIKQNPKARFNALDRSSSPARSSPVILSAAKDLTADRDRPFAEFTLSGAHVLRVTRGDGSNGQVQFVQIEPCLKISMAVID